MLLVICLASFLLKPQSPDRLMSAGAVFASLIAYLFVASQYTPSVPYSTVLDKFINLCFILVVLMGCSHAIIHYVHEKMNEKNKEIKEHIKSYKNNSKQVFAEDDNEDEIIKTNYKGGFFVLSPLRKVDALLMVFFVSIFVVSSGIILAIPASQQK